MLNDTRKYRFGFFGHFSGTCQSYGKADFLENWNRKIFGNLELFTHGETVVQHWKAGDRQLIVVGTIYSVGKESVEAIINKILREGVSSIAPLLNDVSGRFALFFNDGPAWRVYNDAFGSRSMFYSPDRPGVVASHSGIFAEVFNLTPNELTKKFMRSPVYRSRTVQYLPGDLTCWGRVYAVVPNNYLDLNKAKLVRYWPISPKRETTYQEFFEQFDYHVKGLLEAVKNRFLLVGVTGGIDSRAVFAAMLKYGIPFNGVTWLGGYIDKKEMGSVDQIVKTFNIPHKEFSVSDEYSASVAKLAVLNSGSFRGPSRLVAKMHQHYGEDDAIFIRGYGGEIIRGFYNTFSKSLQDFEPREMMRTYGSSNRTTDPISADYNDFGEKMFEYYIVRGNYKNISKFGYDCSDIFYWEHRMGMWGSAMLNEMDCAAYSLVGMNGRRLFEVALGLNPAERLSKKILARVVDDYDKKLSAIKYF